MKESIKKEKSLVLSNFSYKTDKGNTLEFEKIPIFNIKIEKCIYLFKKEGKIIYIGKTNNLKDRIKRHKVQGVLSKNPEIKFIFVYCLKVEEDGRTIEREVT